MYSQIKEYEIDLSVQMHGDLKKIALKYYGSFQGQLEDMLRKFIRVAPWEAVPRPLPWEAPPSYLSGALDVARFTLDEDLSNLVDDAIDSANRFAGADIDRDVFFHTALTWWITHVWPPRTIH